MTGVELRDGELIVEREPTALDRLAIDAAAVLSDLDVDHVFVAGYVAILSGRSRGTEDIDVIIERLDDSRAAGLADALSDAGFWGSAMPLSDLHATLSGGANLRVARQEAVIPNVELSYAGDEFDRASLRNAMTARIADAEIPIGPPELGIAYKLYLGTRTDFEDALHLHTMFEESLSTADLEEWVRKLGVEEEYDRLEEI
jgi:hypothetical protein